MLFSTELRDMLGLRGHLANTSEEESKSYFSKPDLFLNYRCVYLHCDFISPNTCVQNTVHPIIASCVINYENDDTTTVTFNAPVYMDINVHRLESLNMMIMDEQLRVLMSDEGAAHCKLHIRKRE